MPALTSDPAREEMTCSKPKPELPLHGARFRRCALQVNPHHYKRTYQGVPNEGDPRDHARAIIRRASELSIEAIAITDHHSVEGIDEFRRAADDLNAAISIFPGFELESHEGIHILCIYPQHTPYNTLRDYLAEFKLSSPNHTQTLSSYPFTDVLDLVHSHSGVAIAAHVTEDKGLFNVLTGKARIAAWTHQALSAIQIPQSVEDLPFEFKTIVRNKDANYRRDYVADEGLAVAAINACDVTTAKDLDKKSATCWIKMSNISIEGLRQAFLDPVSRIRLSADVPDEEHSEIVSIRWEGGFLDGLGIRFDPSLNVLIGGRGAGKSTVIESLRYVLDIRPRGDDAGKLHDAFVQNVLRPGTKISLRLRATRPTVKDYLVERTIPNPPVVRQASNGSILNFSPSEILTGIGIYGQHEISEIIKNDRTRTSLLDRFIKRNPDLDERKNTLKFELDKNRQSIVRIRAEMQTLETQLLTLPRLEENLQRFKEAGLDAHLSEKSLLVKEEQILESIPERLQPFQDCLDVLRQEVPIDQAFLSKKALNDLPGGDILAKSNDILKQLSGDLENTVSQLERSLVRATKSLDSVRTEWSARKEQVNQSYQKILRKLQGSAVDGERFIQLRREFERLQPLSRRQDACERQMKECKRIRRSLLDQWKAVRSEEFTLLKKAAKQITHKLDQILEVSVIDGGDRSALTDALRDALSGRLHETIKKLRGYDELSLSEFVESCRSGAEAVQAKYSLTEAQAHLLASLDEKTLMRIEELELTPTTQILLNVSADSHSSSDAQQWQPLEGQSTGQKAPGHAADPHRDGWQPLESLSTGQKATAVLLLLLLESGDALIIDQPEDDLDNRFITDGIVPRLRTAKHRRQFILSTHNANIPVLGDAELILGLTPEGSAAHGSATVSSEHAGSIDTPSVCALIEDILEGGREAFERRRRKYGF